MRIHKLFRLCELYPAQKLLNAAELNRDDVYTRIVFCYEGGAKDIITLTVCESILGSMTVGLIQ